MTKETFLSNDEDSVTRASRDGGEYVVPDHVVFINGISLSFVILNTLGPLLQLIVFVNITKKMYQLVMDMNECQADSQCVRNGLFATTRRRSSGCGSGNAPVARTGQLRAA